MISAIFAMARNGVLGCDNKLPWHLPADMAYFKKKTLGHPVIMGRKTFESIGKPLPGRRNIILTRNILFAPKGCEVCPSVNEALGMIHEEEAFVIGGSEIYDAFMPVYSRLYVTHIDVEVEGDCYFSNPDLIGWKLVSRVDGIIDHKNKFPHAFCIYERE